MTNHCYVVGCSNGDYRLKRWARVRCEEHNGVYLGEEGCDCEPPFRYITCNELQIYSPRHGGAICRLMSSHLKRGTGHENQRKHESNTVTTKHEVEDIYLEEPLTEPERVLRYLMPLRRLHPGYDAARKWFDTYDITLEAGIKNLRLKYWDQIKKANEFNPKRHAILGPDLSAAHYLVANGGKVKFVDDNKWYERYKDGRSRSGWNYDLPKANLPEFKLEAAYCEGLFLLSDGLDIFKGCEHLQYLSVRNCRYIDDYFLDRLTRFADSLVHLDLSGCKKVTARGISSLARLRKLRRLELEDMPHIVEAQLLAIELENTLPMLRVEGIDYNDLSKPMVVNRDLPTFLSQFEKAAVRFLRRTKRIKPDEEIELLDSPVNPIGVPLLPPGEEAEAREAAAKQLAELPRPLPQGSNPGQTPNTLREQLSVKTAAPTRDTT